MRILSLSLSFMPAAIRSTQWHNIQKRLRLFSGRVHDHNRCLIISTYVILYVWWIHHRSLLYYCYYVVYLTIALNQYLWFWFDLCVLFILQHCWMLFLTYMCLSDVIDLNSTHFCCHFSTRAQTHEHQNLFDCPQEHWTRFALNKCTRRQKIPYIPLNCSNEKRENRPQKQKNNLCFI